MVNFSAVNSHLKSVMGREHNQKAASWLVKASMRHILKTRDGLIKIDPSELKTHESNDSEVVRAIMEGQTLMRYIGGYLEQDFDTVLDWLAGLADREPGRYRRLNRMTFEQALNASRQWHQQLARKAEKLRDRSIPDDQENAPTVLEVPELGEGWHWVWLKTSVARELEGASMGHCVGSGGYEHLKSTQGLLITQCSR